MLGMALVLSASNIFRFFRPICDGAFRDVGRKILETIGELEMNGFRIGLGVAAVAFATVAHAGQASQGCDCKGTTGALGIGVGRALGGSPAAGDAAAGQSGQGGYYYGPRDGSVVDNYQPWPEAEMRRFQRK